nr:ORF6C domain-containing protein [uncultured Tyzzerella sp.]
MNNKITLFENGTGLKVRTILNEDGSISINAEDVAIGLGWTTVAKSGNEVVRWNRVNKYLKELGFSQQVAKDDYIPESLFYLLAMKANNESALAYQKWLAVDVVPTLRKTGTYTMKPKTPIQLLELEFQAIKEVDKKVEDVKHDLEEFKQDMPLLALEIEKITRARNRTAVNILGGKDSNAYKNRSLRSKVYQDMSREIKRQFGVETYKAIKRNQCDKVIEIINLYIPPMHLAEEIKSENLQIAI